MNKSSLDHLEGKPFGSEEKFRKVFGFHKLFDCGLYHSAIVTVFGVLLFMEGERRGYVVGVAHLVVVVLCNSHCACIRPVVVVLLWLCDSYCAWIEGEKKKRRGCCCCCVGLVVSYCVVFVL